MEGLTRLRTSRRAFRSHVTRILGKVEETLAKEIDEVALTYLRTAVTQLQKKLDQISKLDEQIMELIQEPEELEEVILDSEEVQDLIVEKINELNTRLEILSRPTSHTPTVLDSDDEVVNGTSEASDEIVNDTAVSVSTCTYDTPSASDTPLVNITPINDIPTAVSVFTSTLSNSVSSVSYTPVSYVHSLGPPPLIPRVTNTMSLSSGAGNPTSLLPSLSTLNLGISSSPSSLVIPSALGFSSSPSLAGIPSVSTMPSRALLGATSTTIAAGGYNQSQQFGMCRLPKLTLPTFSGNPLHWSTFWDSFQAAIDLNPNLSGVQKFNYLKAQLEGDAARTIEGFPLTDNNYSHAVAILQDRFGQPHKVISAHMRALLELPKPVNNLTSLRVFHDTIESHSRGLSSLGKSEDTYGDMFVPIILGKLPRDIRQNLARETATSQWTFSELMSAILKEIRILETGSDDLYKSQSHITAAFLINSKPQGSKPKLPSCVFCKGSHAAHQCTEVTDYQRRLDIVKQNHLCFNCLAKHRVSQCSSKFRCRHCKRKHHTSLCNGDHRTDISRSTSQITHPPATTTTTTPVSSFLTPASHQTTPICLLKTAIAPVVCSNTRLSANILFDEGAQRSFICSQLASKLCIVPSTTTQVALSSFGSDQPSFQTLGVATIQIQTITGDLVPVSVLIVPKIATPIQNSCQVELENMPHLKGLKLANPVTNSGEFLVSVLIGADYYWSFVQDNIIRGNGPTAQQSRLGYLLSGPLPFPTKRLPASILLQFATAADNTETDLQQLWSIKAIGTESNQPGSNFLKSYQSHSISQLPDGTYTAKFPWKDDKPHLPSNYNICKGRTKHLLTRLRQSPQLLKLYDTIIMEQEHRGFIERVNDIPSLPTSESSVHYLPHHPVKKDSQTTPIRIVYDCSCRESPSEASLNDCLEVGPPLLNDLCSILLRFRLHNYALSTDIEKAFLHVKLHEDDRDCTRFLWPVEPENPDSHFQIFRFTSVPFGTASSPFMLHATIDLHLHKFQSPVSEDIQHNIYVDNVISGCDTETELVQYYTEARNIMKQANFNLRSWASNSTTLQQVTTADKTIDNNTTVQILGLLWNTCTDTMSLSPKSLPSSNMVSKRSVLQDSSQIFDPLGWATPVSIRAKILLQEIWQQKCSWDTPLQDELCDKWLGIRDDIIELSKLTFPRAYFPHPLQKVDYHLFVFADASTKAYGAIVYLCNNSNISIVMSKARVAPIKALTLPKLELMAAVVATRVAKFVQTSLSVDRVIPVHLWTDSQIVLHWINNGGHSNAFVRLRVTEILKNFPSTGWSFTPSADNPADLLTRGISTEQLKSSELWIHGPHWLSNPSNWPTWTPTNILDVVVTEATEFVPSTAIPLLKDRTDILTIVDISRFSQLNRLLGTIAYIYRFIHNVSKLQPLLSGPLSSLELTYARQQLIIAVQHCSFPEELAYLLKTSSKCPHLVKQLRLFIDDRKLIRCGGRIHNAPTSELSKFPYLLPRKHRITDMIVMNTHKDVHHGGVSITMTALRQTFWIPSMRQCVKSLLRRCVPCRKITGKPYRAPDPPPLPKIRVTEAPPFTITGVDFTGALFVKEGDQEKKVYICLFTCAVTRAVHLEVVGDLTVETFLLAFRRFSSRKSLPCKMISDNASTYLAAAEAIQKLLQSEALKGALERQNVTWEFIPKRAPWYGGFWERIIGLTKQAVKKTLGRAFISREQLETIIVEVEAMLNDRPLTYVSSDLCDPEPLTPSCLLYGRRLQRFPYGLEDRDDIDDPDFLTSGMIKKQVDKRTQVIRQFWMRWRSEYLTSLREFHKSTGHNKQVINKGDVVIVHDDKARLYWKLAIVEDLIQGKDGYVRAANIRMGNLRTSRPIVKLYPLEVSNCDNEELQTARSKSDQQETIDTQVHGDRPRRKAATKALQQMSEWADILNCAREDVENN